MNQKLLEQFQKELNKNKVEIDNSKEELIKEILKVDKEKIFQKTEKKTTIWMRIKKVLGF